MARGSHGAGQPKVSVVAWIVVRPEVSVMVPDKIRGRVTPLLSKAFSGERRLSVECVEMVSMRMNPRPPR